MQVSILISEAYWAFREPFDRYLPESVPAEEVEADLESMEARFREAISAVGVEGEDWEFPGHYQHVRVFYVYLYSRKLFTPQLPNAIQDAMKGFESLWIGEFECYDVPGREVGMMSDMVYQNGAFIFCEDDEVGALLLALGLQYPNPT